MSVRTCVFFVIALALVAAGCSEPGPKPAGKNTGSDAAPAGKNAPKGSPEERADTTLYALEVVDPQTAFAWGTNDEGFVGSVVLKTTDGGAHWACVLRTDQSELVGLDFLDAQNGVAVSDGGIAYTTADGGATWKGSNDLGLFAQRYALANPPPQAGGMQEYASIDGIAFSGDKSGWAFGERQENAPGGKPGRISTITKPVVVKTTDGGATWKDVKLAGDLPTVGLKRAFFADAQNGVVTGGDIDEEETGALLRTTDGGATWKAVTPNAKQVPEDVWFVDATHGWAVGATEDDTGEPGPSQVYATADGGQTWQAVGKVPAALRAVRFADAQNGWAAGMGGKIFKTSDGGATWVEQTQQDWGGGQMIDLTDPIDPKGGPQPTFTAFVLLAPGHGFASSDMGIYEYKAK